MHVLLIIFRLLLGLAPCGQRIAPAGISLCLLREDFVSRLAMRSKVFGMAVGWMYTRRGLKTIGRPPDRYSLVPVVSGDGARGLARHGGYHQPVQLRF